MQPCPDPPPRARLGPSLALLVFGLAAGMSLALPVWMLWQSERGRSEGLRLELMERSHAAERVRAALAAAQAEAPERSFTALRAQLGGIAVPPEERARTPWWALLPVLVVAVAGAVFVFLRWARPLAALEGAARAGREVEVGGSPAVRSLARALVTARQQQQMQLRLLDSNWQTAFQAAAGGVDPARLPSPMREAAKDLARAYDERQSLRRADLLQVVEAYSAARAVARNLRRAAKKAEGAWELASLDARRAEGGLVAVGPELEARYALEKDRVEEFKTAVRTFQVALDDARARATELAAQAHRATDAAAREASREARIAWSGHAPPVEAPPLSRWAEELELTARGLEAAIRAVNHPLRLEPSDWSELEHEALTGMVACARSTRNAISLTGPLIRAVGEWAERHDNDLTGASLRIGGVDPEGPEAAAHRAPLGGVLADVDAAAEGARTRVEAAASRAERLLEMESY